MSELIYLASPYRNKDVRIERLRYEHVSIITAKLMNAGVLVFCPIVNSHDIYTRGLIIGDDSILVWDIGMLDHCDELWILCLDGWEKSVGVKTEIDHAHLKGIPVKYLDYIEGDYALRS